MTPRQSRALQVGSIAFLDGGRDVGSTLKLSGSRIVMIVLPLGSTTRAAANDSRHCAVRSLRAAVATPHGSSTPEVDDA